MGKPKTIPPSYCNVMNHNTLVMKQNSVFIYKEKKSVVTQERNQVVCRSAEVKAWVYVLTVVSVSLMGGELC